MNGAMRFIKLYLGALFWMPAFVLAPVGAAQWIFSFKLTDSWSIALIAMAFGFPITLAVRAYRLNKPQAINLDAVAAVLGTVSWLLLITAIGIFGLLLVLGLFGLLWLGVEQIL
jgi:hypothetical protein